MFRKKKSKEAGARENWAKAGKWLTSVWQQQGNNNNDTAKKRKSQRPVSYELDWNEINAKRSKWTSKDYYQEQSDLDQQIMDTILALRKLRRTAEQTSKQYSAERKQLEQSSQFYEQLIGVVENTETENDKSNKKDFVGSDPTKKKGFFNVELRRESMAYYTQVFEEEKAPVSSLQARLVGVKRINHERLYLHDINKQIEHTKETMIGIQEEIIEKLTLEENKNPPKEEKRPWWNPDGEYSDDDSEDEDEEEEEEDEELDVSKTEEEVPEPKAVETKDQEGGEDDDDIPLDAVSESELPWWNDDGDNSDDASEIPYESNVFETVWDWKRHLSRDRKKLETMLDSAKKAQKDATNTDTEDIVAPALGVEIIKDPESTYESLQDNSLALDAELTMQREKLSLVEESAKRTKKQAKKILAATDDANEEDVRRLEGELAIQRTKLAEIEQSATRALEPASKLFVVSDHGDQEEANRIEKTMEEQQVQLTKIAQSAGRAKKKTEKVLMWSKNGDDPSKRFKKVVKNSNELEKVLARQRAKLEEVERSANEAKGRSAQLISSSIKAPTKEAKEHVPVVAKTDADYSSTQRIQTADQFYETVRDTSFLLKKELGKQEQKISEIGESRKRAKEQSKKLLEDPSEDSETKVKQLELELATQHSALSKIEKSAKRARRRAQKTADTVLYTIYEDVEDTSVVEAELQEQQTKLLEIGEAAVRAQGNVATMLLLSDAKDNNVGRLLADAILSEEISLYEYESPVQEPEHEDLRYQSFQDNFSAFEKEMAAQQAKLAEVQKSAKSVDDDMMRMLFPMKGGMDYLQSLSVTKQLHETEGRTLDFEKQNQYESFQDSSSSLQAEVARQQAQFAEIQRGTTKLVLVSEETEDEPSEDDIERLQRRVAATRNLSDLDRWRMDSGLGLQNDTNLGEVIDDDVNDMIASLNQELAMQQSKLANIQKAAKRSRASVIAMNMLPIEETEEINYQDSGDLLGQYRKTLDLTKSAVEGPMQFDTSSYMDPDVSVDKGEIKEQMMTLLRIEQSALRAQEEARTKMFKEIDENETDDDNTSLSQKQSRISALKLKQEPPSEFHALPEYASISSSIHEDEVEEQNKILLKIEESARKAQEAAKSKVFEESDDSEDQNPINEDERRQAIFTEWKERQVQSTSLRGLKNYDALMSASIDSINKDEIEEQNEKLLEIQESARRAQERAKSKVMAEDDDSEDQRDTSAYEMAQKEARLTAWRKKQAISMRSRYSTNDSPREKRRGSMMSVVSIGMDEIEEQNMRLLEIQESARLAQEKAKTKVLDEPDTPVSQRGTESADDTLKRYAQIAEWKKKQRASLKLHGFKNWDSVAESVNPDVVEEQKEELMKIQDAARLAQEHARTRIFDESSDDDEDLDYDEPPKAVRIIGNTVPDSPVSFSSPTSIASQKSKISLDEEDIVEAGEILA